MKYTLMLIANDGTVVEQWAIGDDTSEDADITYPIVKFGVSELAEELNRAIRLAEVR